MLPDTGVNYHLRLIAGIIDVFLSFCDTGPT